MPDFFDTVAQHTALTSEGTEALVSILKKREVSEGEILIKEHSICNHIYFIESGLTRTYYYKDGKDITDWISVEGTFSCSIVSFISRKPDRRQIETLENSVLHALKFYELEQLYAKHHDVERLGRLLVSQGLIQLQQRFDDLHFATAAERYAKIMQETPTLIQRVPLGMLASYLGITQETLSRIRSKAPF